MRLVQKVSATFMNTGGCVACHAQPLTAFAAKHAKEHGIAVDDVELQASLAADKAQYAAAANLLVLGIAGPAGVDGVNYSLMHFSAAGYRPDSITDAMVLYVASQQTANGNWHTSTVARAPMEDRDIVKTALSVRSLTQFGWEGQRSNLSRHVDSARQWLLAATPVFNEEFAMQLLGVMWAGGNPLPLAGKLISQQQEDGGWPQNANLRSDAYATGQTLYALCETGAMRPGNPAFQRGIAFLMRTQHPDGSWHVISRAPEFQPYFQSGFPYDHDQWISMAGTSWATTALTLAIEPQH